MLLGFLNAPDQTTPAPHRPRGLLSRHPPGFRHLPADPSSDWLLAAFVAAIVLAPLAGWPTLRIVTFFLIAMAVAWLQMALNSHTGGTVHHAILLWPWPEAVVAISFAGVSRRLGRFGAPALAAATALVVLVRWLVTNEYYAKIVRNGGSPTWSAAVFPLAESLKDSGRCLCLLHRLGDSRIGWSLDRLASSDAQWNPRRGRKRRVDAHGERPRPYHPGARTGGRTVSRA